MKIPKIKTTITFLKSKDWKLEAATKSKKYYYLGAPNYLEFKEPFHLKVPKNKGGKEFKEYMVQLGFSIAALYDWDKFDLLDLLSKSLSEIKSDVNYQK